MKKALKYILVFVLAFICSIGSVDAREKNTVNLYLFHRNSCPHCKKMISTLNKLEKRYDNLHIYKYEIESSVANQEKLKELEVLFNIKILSVPFVAVGEKTFVGFNETQTEQTLNDVIEYYSNHGYQDAVGEKFGIKDLPKYAIGEESSSVDEYVKEKYIVNVPLIGKINLQSLALPFVTIVLGLLDGFNPCAMWVLLFLITMLIGMKNRRRMWALGITFLLTSAIIYMCFMLAWLNITSYLSSITIIRYLIAIVAVIGGLVNLRSYIKSRKEVGCTVVDDKKRKKIFARIKKFTSEKSFILSLLGVIALAVSVNFIELLCSAGIPVMYTQILSLNVTSEIEKFVYILVYILFFLFDDLIVFIIAMFTLKVSGISNKYGNFSHLIGGIILILIGILLAFNPGLLMFGY